MIESLPSRTAERVAMRRAAHQLLDDPRVHDDPLALVILGEGAAAAVRADPRRFERGPGAPVLRAFLALRSRLAEDSLARAVAAGVRQYVVLGAGLDTFAYRNPYPALRVFEVDHPATQAWKRRRLAEAQITVPEGVRFAAVDLATLTAIAPFAANGGGVVFDYNVPTTSLAPLPRASFEALAARVAAAGEPFRGFFEPGTLVRAMRAIGFYRVRDFAPDELNAIFFSNRTDGLRVGSAGHILTAFG